MKQRRPEEGGPGWTGKGAGARSTTRILRLQGAAWMLRRKRIVLRRDRVGSAPLNASRSTQNTTAVWPKLYGPIRWENIFQPLQRDAEANLEPSMTGRSQNFQVLSGMGVPARSGLQLSTINILLGAPWESFPAIILELLSECAGLRVHPDSSFSLFQPVRH